MYQSRDHISVSAQAFFAPYGDRILTVTRFGNASPPWHHHLSAPDIGRRVHAPDIPHRGPDFGEFLSVKPFIPLSQELE